MRSRNKGIPRLRALAHAVCPALRSGRYALLLLSLPLLAGCIDHSAISDDSSYLAIKTPVLAATALPPEFTLASDTPTPTPAGSPSGAEVLFSLPPQTCPDKFVFDETARTGYYEKDGKKYISGGEDLRWIQQNCPDYAKHRIVR